MQNSLSRLNFLTLQKIYNSCNAFIASQFNRYFLAQISFSSQLNEAIRSHFWDFVESRKLRSTIQSLSYNDLMNYKLKTRFYESSTKSRSSRRTRRRYLFSHFHSRFINSLRQRSLLLFTFACSRNFQIFLNIMKKETSWMIESKRSHDVCMKIYTYLINAFMC